MYLAEVLEETSRRLASEGLESTDSVLPSIATHHTGIAGNFALPFPGERNRKNDTLLTTSARLATSPLLAALLHSLS